MSDHSPSNLPVDPRTLHCASSRPNRRTSAAAFAEDPPQADDPLLGFAPYVHSHPRGNSITPERQRAFIAELAACGIVTQAARRIGASLEALYKLRNRAGAEGFRAAWEEAVDRGVGRLEDCALARALEGEERPLVWRGEVIGSWRRHDNSLLMFLLRQRRRERYAASDRPTELRPGHPVYDRLKREWQAEQGRLEMEREEEVLASIRRKIALIQQREQAWQEMQQEEEAQRQSG